MKKVKRNLHLIDRRYLIVLIILIIVLLLVMPQNYLKPARNFLWTIVKPVSTSSNYSVNRLVIFFRGIINIRSQIRQNQTLVKENLELQSQVAILKEAQHENEVLKKEIGFLASSKDLKLLPSDIIGRSLTGYLKTIVIDRGVNHGVREHQGVVSEGFLVGTVTEARSDSSVVTLITDSNSLVPVVLEDSRGTGLLRGGLKGLTVEDIPLNIPINQGEKVVTSGLGGDIPLGIAVGSADQVVSKEGEIFQKVTVNSPVQMYFLEFVFLIQ